MAFGFGKKKEKEINIPPPIKPLKDLPTDKILMMRQQGISNNEIIQTLQREGYPSSQIYDAINQADLNQPVAPELPYPQEKLQTQQYPVEDPKEKIEELVEVIIDEKWNELVKDLHKIMEWKEKIEKRINSLEQKNDDIKNSIDSLQRNVLAKVGEYDKNITNVGTSLKAMEKVFSKVLPTFTENVNELSRITKKIKR